ncbi:MAG: glycyl-tRNA synthetase beta chain [Gammaproteobacteria bacterium]|nr:glycyl-tRNA synthetase beta chain [Gammaproteobacteria bacterium]
MKVERRDFLVEIGTEELPPKALRGLEQAFASGLRSGLDKAVLEHGDLISFATPRRLAVWVKRLAASQPEQDIKRRGPPVSAAFDGAGAPTRAALAFAQSCGTTVEALQRVDEGKGAFLFFVGNKPGAAVGDLLPGIVRAALEALPIPRRMRWGSSDAEFVRPVHWLIMLYGKDVIPTTLLDTAAGNMTRGHRFHAPKPIRITSPASYERALRERGYVLPDFAVRRELIRERVNATATELGGRALIGEALLDEVTALVEWPVPLAGRFEERFLQLPREVLISTLQEHQRYFPVEDEQRRLLPCFITVSNIESRDPSKVREGNERVVRPRLADAAFFWDQDRKQPLAARRDALNAVTFQVKLGSIGDKTRRVRALAGEIAAVRNKERAETERAAELCKCDLLTAMVGEFPELQGIMGTYYALADGETPEVAVAIREHYLPRGAGDELPETHPGLAVAIADKLDTLAGIFAVGEKPTGTRDPLGLRRAAIGVLRILIETGIDLDLRQFVGRAVELARVDIERIAAAAGKPAPVIVPQSVAADVYDYIVERLRAYYLEGGGTRPTIGAATMTTEMFDAVLASSPVSPLDFDARLKALRAFLELPEAVSLTAANKRIANILRKAGGTPSTQIDVGTLREAAEVRLFDSLRALRDAVSVATAQREYANALGRLAQLRPAVDEFFDQVMVMDEDPKLRANRLALLAQLQALFAGVADLSRLPG